MKLKLLLSALIAILIYSSCQREYTFGDNQPPATDTGTIGGTAQYTLGDSTGSCAQAVVGGTYTVGVATTAANTITLEVDVDSIGTWVINTGTLNGVSFSGTNSFTTTGTQTIVLKATGTPTAAGTINFIMGAASCTLTVTIAPAPTGGVTGSFKAKIDGTQWVADRVAQGARMNGIINISGVGLDKKMVAITVQDSGVHQYTLAWDNSSLGAGAFSDSASGNTTAFTSNSGSTPAQAGGVLNITSIDDVNKTMSGTFSFKAYRPTTNETKNITEGVFTNIPYVTTITSPNATDTFDVKIDGVSFISTLITGINTPFLSKIAITGGDNTGSKTVAVYFPPDVTVGTYTIGSVFSTYGGQYNINSTTFLSSTTGTLEILYHDPAAKRVRGRFSFSAAQTPPATTTAELTEGYFAVTYQ